MTRGLAGENAIPGHANQFLAAKVLRKLYILAERCGEVRVCLGISEPGAASPAQCLKVRPGSRFFVLSKSVVSVVS